MLSETENIATANEAIPTPEAVTSSAMNMIMHPGPDHTSSGSKYFSLKNAFHAVHLAFTGFLAVLIGLKYPDHPTAFATHKTNMAVAMASVCLYYWTLMAKILIEFLRSNNECAQLFLDYVLVFGGVLTPTSLVSVLLPYTYYNPICLMIFISLLLLSLLAHYFFIINKSFFRTTLDRFKIGDLLRRVTQIPNPSGSVAL